MGKANLRVLTRPNFVRGLNFSSLISLLRKFDGYFKNVVHFDYECDSPDKFNYDQFIQIILDQSMVGEYAELFDALALIGAMSSESRGEILREFVNQQPYADELKDDASPADIALLVYLHDPDGLRDLDIEVDATRKKSFAMRATDYDLNNVEISPEQLNHFEEMLNEVFVSKNRGKTAKIMLANPDDDDLYIVVRHGDTFKRQGAIDSGKKSKTLAFQPENFDLLVLNRSSNELRICVPASPRWLEDCYAQTLGKVLFNDYNAFDQKRVHQLNRIKELGKKVVICSGVPGIASIGLTKLCTSFSDGYLVLSSGVGNVFREMADNRVDLNTLGDIQEAKFLINPVSGTPFTITLTSGNRSGYDYSGLGRSIDLWLRKVGILGSSKVLEAA